MSEQAFDGVLGRMRGPRQSPPGALIRRGRRARLEDLTPRERLAELVAELNEAAGPLARAEREQLGETLGERAERLNLLVEDGYFLQPFAEAGVGAVAGEWRRVWAEAGAPLAALVLHYDAESSALVEREPAPFATVWRPG
jgi:hypothetical protein